MKPGGLNGHSNVRARQYISFFILAVFLGLFVGAMTKSPTPTFAQSCASLDYVAISHSQPLTYTPELRGNELKLTFANMSVMELRDATASFAPREKGSIQKLRVEGDSGGAQLIVSLTPGGDKCVRLLRFSSPHQVMINVSEKNCLYDSRAVQYTSASLYNA